MAALVVELLPLTTDFLHDLECRHVWIFSLDPLASLTYKDHVCREALLGCCSFYLLKHFFAASDGAESFHLGFEPPLVSERNVLIASLVGAVHLSPLFAQDFHDFRTLEVVRALLQFLSSLGVNELTCFTKMAYAVSARFGSVKSGGSDDEELACSCEPKDNKSEGGSL